MKNILILLITTVTLAFMSCETTSFYRQTHTTTSTLQNTNWQMMTISGFNGEQLNRSVTLQFKSNYQVEGFSGCNLYSSTYIQTNNALSFDNIIATQKSCIPGIETEKALMRALKGTTSFEIESGHLYLKDNAGNRLATFVPVR